MPIAGHVSLLVAATAALASAAHAAPGPSTVITALGEVRACLPLAGGDTLVGTGGGLARVDATGAVRAVWTAVDGLPGTRIDSISRVGTALWIGTEQGAARVTLAEVALTIDAKAGSTAVVDAVAFGGTTYLATAGRGVIDPHGTALPFRDRGKGAEVAARLVATALAVAGPTLYVGTAAGLYQLQGRTLVRVALEPSAAPAVTALAVAGTTVWIATTTGLYARDADIVRAYGGGELRRVAILDGTVLATGLEGSVRVDRGRLVAVDATRAPASVLLQALRGEGGAACAGGLDGLWLRPTAAAAWTHVEPPAGPPANDLSVLAVDGERLYVGTFDHGLALYDHGAWRTLASATLDRRINALAIDRRDHRVWIATAAGLSIVDPETELVTTLGKRDGLPARGALAITQLRDGRMLVGTLHGAVIIGGGRPQLLGGKEQLAVTNVWAVAEDAAGYLWLGTTSGLYRGAADDSAWTRYSVSTGQLADDWVMALAPRGDSLYVGMYKGGVARLDHVDALTTSAIVSTHLLDGYVNPSGLAWDGETLAVSTMAGLRTLDATGQWTTVAGIPDHDVTAIARIGGTRFVASRRGLAIFTGE